MSKLIAGIAAVVGVVIIAILAILYASWASAFVATILWAWFIVPTFGVPALSLPVAFGFALLVALWTHENHVSVCKDERDGTTKGLQIFGAILRPWFILLMAYCCKVWFM